MKLRLTKTISLPRNVGPKRIFLTGMPESGKTYTGMKLAELMAAADIQFIWLDVVGVAWGLRRASDGKSPGIDIPIFGGLEEHSDVPLNPESGAFMAKLLVEKGTSAILDVSLFDDDEQAIFWTAFAREFLKLKKRYRSPVHIFIDEAQTFFPESGSGSKDERKMLQAGLTLWRIGRNFGIGGTLMSQAPQSVHKRAINLSEVLIVHQIAAGHERDAINNWAKYASVPEKVREMIESLGTLGLGEAYFWSPRWLKVFKKVRIQPRWTFDSSATPDEKTKKRKIKPLTKLELADIREVMKGEIEAAEANDIVALQAKVSNSSREITYWKNEAKRWHDNAEVLGKKATEAKGKVTEIPVLTGRDRKRIEKLRALVPEMDGLISKVTKLEIALAATTRGLKESLHARVITGEAPKPADDGVYRFSVRRSDGKPLPTTAEVVGPQSSGLPGVKVTKHFQGPEVGEPIPPPPKSGLKKGARAMLTALATFHPKPLTRSMVATLTGVKPKGRTFYNYLSMLRVGGFATEGPNDTLVITKSGLLTAGSKLPGVSSTEQLVSMWNRKLKKGAREMLAVLVGEYPNAVPREALADQCSIERNGRTFYNYLSMLRVNGLAVVSKEAVRAGDDLFPDQASFARG